MPSPPLLRVVIVGHVDHGKSTLVGRLLHDTQQLSATKLEQIEASSRRRGMTTEWAFALDALQAERDQAITIDAAQVWFHSEQRDYCLIDAPGHKEFIKNMVTGAASAHAALLLVDAAEGLREQSHRHGYLLHLLGVDQIGVIVNKMDRVDFDESTFRKIETDYTRYLESLGAQVRGFVPVSAREGDNLASRSSRMPWYDGPTVVDVLDSFESPADLSVQPLRLPLQAVYKFDDRRLLAGRIETGTLRVGDRVLFSPCHKISTIASLESFPGPGPDSAAAGESVAIQLEEQIFVQRGEVMSHLDSPPFETNVLDARIFWLGKEPLSVGETCKLKLWTQEEECWIEQIHHLVEAETLEQRPSQQDRIHRDDIAEVTLRTRGPVAVDSHDRIPGSGRLVLVAHGRVAGGGLANVSAYASLRPHLTEIKSGDITWSESTIDRSQREKRNRHRGAVVWLTGLSGSGKSTIAQELERQLFHRGCHTYVLDGDNVRHGLNRNLGFSPDDRAENIRRIGEVAKLFADAGTVVVTAFISPYRADRELVRSLLGADEFFEVHVDCPLEVCEERDPKNLYKKARAGKITGFTGIDAPYEAPDTPELTIHTHESDVSACVERILHHLADSRVFEG